MALTLNTSSFSLVSSGGGASGTSSGVSLDAVRNTVEYEYITSVDVISGPAAVTISAGIDNATYEGYKFLIKNLRLNSSNYFYFRVLNSSASPYSNLSYVTERNSSSGSFSYNTSSNTQSIYFDDNNAISNSDHMNGYIEVNLSSIANNHLMGSHFLNYVTGTTRFYTGSFLSTNAQSGFGGIELGSGVGFQSGATIDVYGKRKRI